MLMSYLVNFIQEACHYYACFMKVIKYSYVIMNMKTPKEALYYSEIKNTFLSPMYLHQRRKNYKNGEVLDKP